MNIMPTIIIGKIEIELPDMYMISRFIGNWKDDRLLGEIIIYDTVPHLPASEVLVQCPMIFSAVDGFGQFLGPFYSALGPPMD
jgi:hypothetical protein